MSDRRVNEQTERAQAENAAAEQTVNAFLELLARKEAERREQTKTYRELVMLAADNGGQLSQADIERLVQITSKLDLDVEAFSSDVAAVNRDREHEAAINAIGDRRAVATREHDAAAEEEKRLAREWAPICDEYDRRRREHDEQITKARQARERACVVIGRLWLESSKRSDRQSTDRHSHRRVWGPT